MENRHVDILLIEDSTSDAILVEQMLKEAMGDRFTLTCLSRLSDGLDRLRSEAFDVVLLDLSLPDSRGLKTFVELYDQVSQIPIVVLTGSGDQMLAVQAVQEGAQDYLVKGEVTGALLARSLRYAIERKRSAEALRRERDLVARLMDTSPVGITVVDRDGEIIFANARAEDVLGISVDEITGRLYDAPDWEITDFEGNPLPEEELPFRQVMESREPIYDVRHAVEWPGGERRLLSIHGAPILDETSQGGQVEKIVFVIEDVTEQVEAERERVARLRREIRALAEIAALPDTTVAARSFGAMPLRDSVPDLFDQLVEDYGRLLDVALERRVYKVEPDVAEETRVLAERLGGLRAGPRDVVDVHIAALREKSGRSNDLKVAAYTEEGRLVTLELMGHLVSYYRNRCLSFGGFQRSPSSVMRRE
jgi:PAS domain S-box-containing protein